MNKALIAALEKGGVYEFKVFVRYENDDRIMRIDKIKIYPKDSHFKNVQKQIDEYMSENNVESISLNKEIVWTVPQKKVIIIYADETGGDLPRART
jgi:hypothetical protein